MRKCVRRSDSAINAARARPGRWQLPFAGAWLVLLACLLPGAASLASTDVSGRITANTVWDPAGAPYLLDGTVEVADGAHLVIEAGTSVLMRPGASLRVVSGSIAARGTSDGPIQITSIRNAPGAPGSAAPGDWGVLAFDAGTASASTVLTHVHVTHGQGIVINGASPTLDHLRIEHNAGPAITVDLQSSPVGRGLSASGNELDGILVSEGEITGNVAWALRGIPYVLREGRLAVGAQRFGLSPSRLQLARGVVGELQLTVPDPAPEGGLSVDLVSSVPSVAGVASSVRVPEGARSAGVVIEAAAIGQSVVTASRGGYGSSSVLVEVVQPPMLHLSPSSSVASVGREAILTLTLSELAPVGGRTVSISSSMPEVAGVPESVTVATGQRTVTFPVAGIGLGSAVITAAADGYEPVTANVRIRPVSVNLPESILVAPGLEREFPITLTDPAPAGGLTVSLQVVDPGIASVPATVVVPEGQLAVNAIVSGLSAGNTTLQVSAPGHASDSTPLRVEAIGIELSPAGTISIPQGLRGVYSVRLTRPAPQGGTTIRLASEDAAVAAIAPLEVFVPEGQTSAMSAVSIEGMAQGATHVVASSPGLASARLPVTISQQARLEFSRSTAVVGKGLRNYEWEIYVYRRVGNTYYSAREPLTITLSSADASRFSHPATITIPANQNGVNFRLEGLDVTDAPIELDAAAEGYIPPTQKLAVSVVTPVLAFSELDGSRSVVGGRDNFRVHWQVPGAVSPNHQTAASAQTVALAIDEADPEGVVAGFHTAATGGAPTTQVVIAEGATYSAYVHVDQPTTSGTYRVRASLPGVGSWASAVQTVTAPEVVFSRSAQVVGKGLRNYAWETYIQLRAGGRDVTTAVPLVVELRSSDPSRVPSTTVTVPAGQGYAYFSIEGADLTDSPVQLDAVAEGYSSPAQKLAVSVVTPVLAFSELDGSRSVAGGRDNFRVHWQVPGATNPNHQTAAATQTVTLAIDEAAPEGIVAGFHTAATGGSATTEVTIAQGATHSAYVHVDQPTTSGTYRVRASLPGLGSWTSAVQTVTAPEVVFSRSAVVVGKGLRNYAWEAYIQLRAGGRDVTTAVPLVVELRSSDPARVPSTTVTVPAGQGYAYFSIEGADLTDTPVQLDAVAEGYSSPAQKLAVSVVTPVLAFSELDGNRSTTGARDNFRVHWQVPGATNPGHQTAAATQTVTLAIEEAAPEGIVAGFHTAATGGSATTEVTIAQGATYSAYVHVGQPTGTGSYRVRASLADTGTWSSSVQSVHAPELRFSRGTVVLGKGLRSYAWEVYVQQTVNGTLFNGAEPTVVTLQCASAAICSAPTSVVIPAGQSQINVQLVGNGLGSTRLQGSAVGYQPADGLDVSVVRPVLYLSGPATTVNVGANATFSARLSVPGSSYSTSHVADTAIAIDLTSSQPGVASVPAGATIAAGAASTPNVQLQGLAPGTTTITASGEDLVPVTSPTITVRAQ